MAVRLSHGKRKPDELMCVEHLAENHLKTRQPRMKVCLTRLPKTFNGLRGIERSSTPLDRSSLIYIIAKRNQHIHQQKLNLGGTDYVLNVDCKLKSGEPFHIFDDSGKLVEDLVIDAHDYHVAENGEVTVIENREPSSIQNSNEAELRRYQPSEAVVPPFKIDSIPNCGCKLKQSQFQSFCDTCGTINHLKIRRDSCSNGEKAESCLQGLSNTKMHDITWDDVTHGSGFDESENESADDVGISHESLMSLCQAAAVQLQLTTAEVSQDVVDSPSKITGAKLVDRMDTSILHTRREENAGKSEFPNLGHSSSADSVSLLSSQEHSDGISVEPQISHENLLSLNQATAGIDIEVQHQKLEVSHNIGQEPFLEIHSSYMAEKHNNILDNQNDDDAGESASSNFSTSSRADSISLQSSPEDSDEMSIRKQYSHENLQSLCQAAAGVIDVKNKTAEVSYNDKFDSSSRITSVELAENVDAKDAPHEHCTNYFQSPYADSISRHLSPDNSNELSVNAFVVDHVPSHEVEVDAFVVDQVPSNEVGVDAFTVDQMPSDEVEVDAFVVDQVPSHEVEVDAFVVDQVPSNEVGVDAFTVDQMPSDEVEVDAFVVDQVPSNEVEVDVFTVDQMPSDEVEVDAFVVDQMPSDEVEVDAFVVDQVPSNEVGVDAFTVDQMPSDEVEVDAFVVDQVPSNEVGVDAFVVDQMPSHEVEVDAFVVDQVPSHEVEFDAFTVNQVPSDEVEKDYLSDWQLIESMSAKILELENIKAGVLLELESVLGPKSRVPFDLGEVTRDMVQKEKLQRLENELSLRSESLRLEEKSLCWREKIVSMQNRKLEHLIVKMEIEDNETRLAELARQLIEINMNLKANRANDSLGLVEKKNSSGLSKKRPVDALLENDSVESGRCNSKKTGSGKKLSTWKFTKQRVAKKIKWSCDKASKHNSNADSCKGNKLTERGKRSDEIESEALDCGKERASLFTQLTNWLEPRMMSSIRENT